MYLIHRAVRTSFQYDVRKWFSLLCTKHTLIAIQILQLLNILIYIALQSTLAKIPWNFSSTKAEIPNDWHCQSQTIGAV